MFCKISLQDSLGNRNQVGTNWLESHIQRVAVGGAALHWKSGTE